MKIETIFRRILQNQLKQNNHVFLNWCSLKKNQEQSFTNTNVKMSTNAMIFEQN